MLDPSCGLANIWTVCLTVDLFILLQPVVRVENIDWCHTVAVSSPVLIDKSHLE